MQVQRFFRDHRRSAMNIGGGLLMLGGFKDDARNVLSGTHWLVDYANNERASALLVGGAVALFAAANWTWLIGLIREPKPVRLWNSAAEMIDYIGTSLYKLGYGVDQAVYREGSAHHGVLVDPKTGSNRALVASDGDLGTPLYLALVFNATEEEIQTQLAMPPATRAAMVHDIRLELARFGVNFESVPDPLDTLTIWMTFPVGESIDVQALAEALRFLWRAGLLVSTVFVKAADSVALADGLPPWMEEVLQSKAALPPPTPRSTRRRS